MVLKVLMTSRPEDLQATEAVEARAAGSTGHGRLAAEALREWAGRHYVVPSSFVMRREALMLPRCAVALNLCCVLFRGCAVIEPLQPWLLVALLHAL